MELLTYLGVAILAVCFSFKRDVVPNTRHFFFLWLAVYLTLILIVRESFDADIKNYADAMSVSSYSFYYWREPVVWLGQRYLFSWIQSSFLVFLVSDLLIGLFLFLSFKNFNLPQYAFFSILIFFPFVLGMQNIYRQWAASIFFLWGFSYVWRQKNGIKPYAGLLLSVLSHNVAAVFIPLVFLGRRKFLGKAAWYGAFLLSFAGILVARDTRSSAETGADLSLLYLTLIAFLFVLVPLLDKGIYKKKIRKREYNLLFSLLVLSAFSVVILSSAGAERVSMFCLLVSYPVLVSFLEDRFKQKIPARIIFSILGFIPMFVFDVSEFIGVT